MPLPNVLLLRHLLSVLHKIKGRSSITHMTAYALSVRIAPSMLWNPSLSNSGFGNDISQKASGPLVFCFWEKSLDHDPEAGDTFDRSLLLEGTLVVQSSGGDEALTYFREVWKGACYNELEISDLIPFLTGFEIPTCVNLRHE
jgi:hypothetical protein